jgi:cytochrome P450
MVRILARVSSTAVSLHESHADMLYRPITHDWSYVYGHQHYARYGDSFLLVSPGAIHLYTAEAATIHQVTSKKDAFPKYLESYRILAQWGNNVLTTEGATWRLHRKATSASFNEKNAALVFTESIRQVQGMISSWADAAYQNTKNLETLEHDTMRLALHIISFVGFGLRLSWPNENKVPETVDDNLAKFSAHKPPPGYTTSFVDAVSLLMDYILVLLLVPSFILSRCL